MNDILKLISNSLKPYGYHVRKYKAPNILRIPALEKEDHEQIESFQKATNKHGWGLKPDFADELDHMIIYVRTCIRADRNIDTSKRVTDCSLEESTLRCLRSLVRAVNYADNLYKDRKIEVRVLDDRSDQDAQNKIANVLLALQCSWEINQTDETGQGQSLLQQFSEGRKENAILYFVEDDYLHEIDAIATCWDFYKQAATNFETHSVLYPQEHAILYDDHYPSYLVAGKDRHWRTIRHATHTFITHGRVVDEYWKYFENTKFVGVRKKRKKGSEAKTTNRLFNHIPGFSPLRPAAVHLQFEHTLPPFYDWRPLWDECGEENKQKKKQA